MRLRTRINIEIFKVKIWTLKVIQLYKMAPTLFATAEETLRAMDKIPPGWKIPPWN